MSLWYICMPFIIELSWSALSARGVAVVVEPASLATPSSELLQILDCSPVEDSTDSKLLVRLSDGEDVDVSERFKKLVGACFRFTKATGLLFGLILVHDPTRVGVVEMECEESMDMDFR